MDKNRAEIRVENLDDIPKSDALFVFGDGPDFESSVDSERTSMILPGGLSDIVDEAGNLKTYTLPREGDVLESVDELAGEQPDS